MCEENICDFKEVETTPTEDYLENLVRGREYHRLMEQSYCLAIKAYKAGYEAGRADNERKNK